jgi:hypothetical protein
LSSGQIDAASQYIDDHRDEVMVDHHKILARHVWVNPPELRAKLAIRSPYDEFFRGCGAEIGLSYYDFPPELDGREGFYIREAAVHDVIAYAIGTAMLFLPQVTFALIGGFLSCKLSTAERRDQAQC